MLPQDQLRDKGGHSLVRQVLQDVDILVEPLDRPIVPIVLELLALPPETLPGQKAAAARQQEPGPVVIREGVAENTSLCQCRLEELFGLRPTSWRVFVAQTCWEIAIGRIIALEERCGWVDALDERLLEHKVLIGLDQTAKH